MSETAPLTMGSEKGIVQRVYEQIYRNYNPCAYSGNCDRSIERAGKSQIRCWQTSPNIVEGEQLDINDPEHKYYRRVLSDDAKTLTITWYADAKRRNALDRFVYAKQ